MSDTKYCAGCTDDFYNGKNSMGVKECWLLKNAKVVTRWGSPGHARGDGQVTKDEAIALAKTGWWRTKSPREIAEFQLREPKLCMDFSEFHEAVEKALGRPVFTHEFVRPDWLLDELAGKREALDPLTCSTIGGVRGACVGGEGHA